MLATKKQLTKTLFLKKGETRPSWFKDTFNKSHDAVEIQLDITEILEGYEVGDIMQAVGMDRVRDWVEEQ